MLSDLQIGGVSKFSVSKSGEVVAGDIKLGNGSANISSNLVIGTGSLSNNTVGAETTALGHGSLAANTTGVNNVAVGNNSLKANTTGSSNVSVGFNSLLSNTIGYQNTTIGKDSMKSNTSGLQNTGIGNSALMNANGDMNTAMGFQALGACTSGNRNTGVGVTSLSNLITGTNNVGIGVGAGNGILNTSYNVVIGSYTGSITTDGNVILSDGQGNERVRIPNTGNVLVGTAIDLPSAMLNLKSTTKGVLLPRMTTANRDAIVSPEPWLYITNITTGKLNTYNGTAWVEVGSAATDMSQSSATNISGVVVGRLNSVDGSVGIGSTNNTTNTGALNVAIGLNAAMDATAGDKIVAIGAGAGKLNQSGIEWTAIGSQACSSSVNGSNWVALGYRSGMYAADAITPLTSVNGSIFIGSNTRALAGTSNNEIVIGNNVGGHGSNTATIGNGLIAKTFLNGALEIPVLSAPPSDPADGSGLLYFDYTGLLKMAVTIGGNTINTTLGGTAVT